MSVAALAAGGVAASAAAAAYLNGKYQLTRDAQVLLSMRRFAKIYEQKAKENRLSPWYFVETACQAHGPEPAIWSRSGEYTFAEVYAHSLRYAQWLLEQGIRPGEIVSMYLQNSPEFIFWIFAAWCIGASPGLINYNLEGQGLLHCIDVCGSKVLIVDPDTECQRRIDQSRDEIEGGSRGIKVVTLDGAFKAQLAGYPAKDADDALRRNVKGSDPYILLFTSGTTGLPKGCPFIVSRVHQMGTHIAPPFNGKPGVDTWYSAMPMYHGTAVMSLTTQLLGGLRIAIAPKFSVSGFWPDIHDSGATIFIYVGETARYLLNAPHHPLERQHRLRCAYGNGLRPDVWTRFQERFAIPEVAEFFNSSEGVFGLVVWDRGEYLSKCVGHHGLLLRLLTRKVLVPVEVDVDTGDIWRDPVTGFARRMPYDVGGEMLVKVPDRAAFGGYWNNPEATAKRFATDVFEKGDLYYRSGDALRRTDDGHWYFLDRLGDTFRWKSENVSTAEVAEVLGQVEGVSEANVYGVTVPGHEGRAGCAALTLDLSVVGSQGVQQPRKKGGAGAGVGGEYFRKLLSHARKALPRYAVPVFIRVMDAGRSSHIHNHKQNKVPLRKEGVDPALVGTLSGGGGGGGGSAESDADAGGGKDVILWLPSAGAEEYVEFTETDWNKLVEGSAKL
ncbi:fatty-acyl-CoA synthase [Microdochium trichocladiopsis]|uniref:Very long-chain fatty acid transport protein n=1 Tax=Microdochium trichocladiopsis TaxID=1682393 RepID=A0A9P9BQ97_9PEZI|nr:fatty-acyl-CoA synthase [Microdochium trichocladiopsis]KAH7030618.1 fatty-acyl-CoA synthase [Microdochium trichocladiopsis]